MTELLVQRGDTFPRSFLDTYRASRTSDQLLYNDLKCSKSDELVLQNPTDIPISQEIHHGHSENLLDHGTAVCLSSPSAEDDFDSPPSEILVPRNHHHRRSRVPSDYDRVDPEDSIRDIVTGNDFYRFVLFKKHYDKYVHLSQKYEEARNIAYYLEEKYHEVKMERDDLIIQRDKLTKRLESNECLLREKEDEVFLQFERVVYLEEQCDKLKAEKDKCWQQKQILEKEKDAAYRLLKEQARESECTRRKLERARQEVFHHMTMMKHEKETLERENDQLKEALEAERKGMRKYLNQIQKKQQRQHATDLAFTENQLAENQSTPLASQYQKALQHLASCKKCSVCAYAKATYRKSNRHRYDRKLLGCLQTPFLEMKNMLRPPPSPMRCGEGESLSEWFCHLNTTCPTTNTMENMMNTPPNTSECSSLSVPFAELAISYMDDAASSASASSDAASCCPSSRLSTSSSSNVQQHQNQQHLHQHFHYHHHSHRLDMINNSVDQEEEGEEEDDGLSRVACNSAKGFGSDSGFSSDVCGDYKSSNATTPKDKFSPNGTLDEADCAKLTRTKWTASFRKLINRIKK